MIEFTEEDRRLLRHAANELAELAHNQGFQARIDADLYLADFLRKLAEGEESGATLQTPHCRDCSMLLGRYHGPGCALYFGRATACVLPEDCGRPSGDDRLAERPAGDAENSGQDWMQTSFATVLRHFESEADSADELVRNTEPGAMCSRYQVPWRRRYEVERDTYRYVLKQIRAAETPPAGDAGLRERIERLPTFEPEHAEPDPRHAFQLGNDPIVMAEEEYPDVMGHGEWLRRSDVLAALADSTEGGNRG